MKLAASLGHWFARPRNDGQWAALRAARSIANNPGERAATDMLFVWSGLSLLLLGLVMVFSASIALAEGSRFTQHQPQYFLVRHSLYLAIGILAGFAAFQVPTRRLEQLSPFLFLIGVALLILVLIPGVGREVNGAQRWISLGPINLQPSELMKVIVALYAADYTVRKLDVLGSFMRGFMPMATVILLVAFLLLRQPDFGAMVVISAIAFGILFLGGIGLRIFSLLTVVASAGLALLIWTSPYRRDRLLGFMDPWQDAFGSGYQLSHSLIAFGRGEWFGVGLGGSVEKLFYLPEAHTDFLLAVIAEELGFVGVVVVVLLFAVLIHRCFAIGRAAIKLERYFAGLVAQGIGLWLGVQSFINMGVNMGLLPTKGLTLPLMSYGGSAIVSSCIALAIVLRIDWETRQMKRGSTP